jgi:hypothetical protein
MSLSNPQFYYLANFHKALQWLVARHMDLMDAAERRFVGRFLQLPLAAQALLVRMIMRKGRHFRASKLVYVEIGCPRAAAQALIVEGWIDFDAPIDIGQAFALLRKEEIARFFAPASATRKKSEWLAQLAPLHAEPRPFAAWCPGHDDMLLSLTVDGLCERLQLMFFGNLHQDWSEFVLADLGIFRYETVELNEDSRGFRQREDIDAYLHIQRCRERFEAGEPIVEVLAALGPTASSNPLIAERRARLLLRIGQQLEREADLHGALAVYQASGYAGARHRRVRVLERLERFEQAHALAQEAAAAPESDGEAQLIQRALARLERRLGLGRGGRTPATSAGRIDLRLPRSRTWRVEHLAQAHLHTDEAPVHYVENTLVCGLFGLLCWEAIFAPVPGAFFHPFHAGPMDLLSPDFHARRAGLFAACLARLDSGEYREAIRRTYAEKYGLQSPFVFWGVLSKELLEQALHCLPPEHLAAWFRRLLDDIRANRAGMPDLIQFWPAERRYRMIEVKGPGDRLQDNQRRWLAFCAENGMPVEVCHVQWLEEVEA